MVTKVGIGQDSRRFLTADSTKPCILGGVIFTGVPGLKANSDGDVVFHAICNAITSITGVMIIGDIADLLWEREGITDSEVYLKEAVKTLGELSIIHIAISIEGKRPHFKPMVETMRQQIATVLSIAPSAVGIATTSGEGLTDFGCGDGLQCFAIVTVA